MWCSTPNHLNGKWIFHKTVKYFSKLEVGMCLGVWRRNPIFGLLRWTKGYHSKHWLWDQLVKCSNSGMSSMFSPVCGGTILAFTPFLTGCYMQCKRRFKSTGSSTVKWISDHMHSSLYSCCITIIIGGCLAWADEWARVGVSAQVFIKTHTPTQKYSLVTCTTVK